MGSNRSLRFMNGLVLFIEYAFFQLIVLLHTNLNVISIYK